MKHMTHDTLLSLPLTVCSLFIQGTHSFILAPSIAPTIPRCHAHSSYDTAKEETEMEEETALAFLKMKSTTNRRSLLASLTTLSLSSYNIPTMAMAADIDSHTNSEPTECRNGAILGESAIPGAYQQTCMGLPSRSIRLNATGDTIRIYQGTSDGDSDGTPQNDGSMKKDSNTSVAGRTGVALWNSGLLLFRLLDAIATEQMQTQVSSSSSSFFQSKTVLELGCGTALASIAASKLGAARVIATDGNGEVQRLAQRNLDVNGIERISSLDESAKGGEGEAAVLQWSWLDASEYYGVADVVLGSDLTYNSGSWGLLAETMDAVLAPNGVIIYLTLGHAGFNVSGELGGFLTVVESQGNLEVVRAGEERWPFGNISSLERILNGSLTSRERDVIAATGGYRIVVLKKKKRRRR